MKDYLNAMKKHLSGLPPKRAEEILEEINSHLTEKIYALELQGFSTQEANEKAQQELGDPRLLATRLRNVHKKFLNTSKKVIVALGITLFILHYYGYLPRVNAYFLENIIQINDFSGPYIPTVVAATMATMTLGTQTLIAFLVAKRLYNITLSKQHLSNALIAASITAVIIAGVEPFAHIVLHISDALKFMDAGLIQAVTRGAIVQIVTTLITIVFPFLIVSTYAHYRKKDSVTA